MLAVRNRINALPKTNTSATINTIIHIQSSPIFGLPKPVTIEYPTLITYLLQHDKYVWNRFTFTRRAQGRTALRETSRITFSRRNP